MEVTDLRVPGRNGPIPVRSYGSSDRVLVWAHGGGFVHGDLDMAEADWVSRTIAATGVRVLSVGYRLIGPGVAFSAPSDDVTDVLAWAIEAAPGTVFAGGASAGANLVTGAVMRLGARASAVRRLLLVYPTLHARQPHPDDTLRALLARTPDPDAFSQANVRRMYETYVGGDPAQAPAFAVPGQAGSEQLAALPPVTIIAAEADELRLSAEAFAHQLRAAGVDVDFQLAAGTVHGFLDTPDVPAAARTVASIASWISSQPLSDSGETTTES